MYIWFVFALVCFLYFIVCIATTGVRAAFNFVWLAAALFCMAVFLALRAHHRGLLHFPLWLRAGAFAVFSVGLLYFAVLEGLVISKMWDKPDKSCDYVIVLGAYVRGETVSNVLKERLDAAYNYAVAEGNTDCKVIVSGGQGADEIISEGEAMRRYLVEKGLPNDRILVEDTSTDTNENLDNSFRLYMALDGRTAEDRSIVVVTSNFHLYRAVRLAKAKDIGSVNGLAAPSSRVLLLNNMVREAVGITKELVFGNF